MGSTAKLVAKYLIAVALLAFVVGMNWTALNKLFRQPPQLDYLALAGVILVTVTAIQFYRWYLLVRALGLPFRVYDALRLGLVGLFYNTFLPGSVGGDVVKAVFIARGHPERKAAAVATVIADRLIGLFGLILFSAAVGGGCWLAGDQQIATNTKLQGVIVVCAGLASSAVVGYFLLGIVNSAAAERIRHRLIARGKFGPTLAELWFTVWQYRQRPGTVVTVVLMSAVVHTGFVLIFHLCVRVFPPDASQLGTLPEHFVIIPIGYIVQALIPLPGGLGGAELSFGGLYNLIRPGAAEVGTAGRLTMRLLEWGIGLAGYIAFLRMKNEMATTTDTDSSPEPQTVSDGV